MENHFDRRLITIQEKWISANKLYNNGFYRQSIVMYWHSFREYLHLHFDRIGIDYSGTMDVLMLALKDEEFKLNRSVLSFLYTTGVSAEWDSFIEITRNDVVTYRNSIKSFLNEKIIELNMNESKVHYEEIVTEVKRHLEDAESSRNQHWVCAERFRNWKFRFEFTISIVTSALILLLTTFDDEIKVVPKILSVILIFLTTLRYLMKLDEKANQHWIAAQNYQRLVRNLKNWKSDFPNESFINEATITIKFIRERITEINRDAPPLSDWSYNKVKSNKKLEESSRYDTTDQGISED